MSNMTFAQAIKDAHVVEMERVKAIAVRSARFEVTVARPDQFL